MPIKFCHNFVVSMSYPVMVYYYICVVVLVDVGQEDYEYELKAAKQREQELIRLKSDNEAAFSQQRAKFIELFHQKEGKCVLISAVLAVITHLGEFVTYFIVPVSP